MNKAVIVAGAVALVILGFIAGAFLGPKIPIVANTTGAGTARTAGPGGMNGGPMPQLTEAERAEIENMTEEERQQFFQEQMGSSAPGGAQGAGGPGGRGGLTVEGVVLEVSGESMTVQTADGGSQTIYLDDATVIAYAEGSEASGLAKGDAVIVTARPEADNVMNATTVIVK
jgi:hypothetical protein